MLRLAAVVRKNAIAVAFNFKYVSYVTLRRNFSNNCH